MLARRGDAAAARRASCGVRDQVGRHPGDRSSPTTAACELRGPQRHATSRRATRSCATLGRALGARRVVLDGEVVALRRGGPAELRAPPAAHAPRLGLGRQAPRCATSPVTYVIFDLLYLDGHSHDARCPTTSAASCSSELELDGPAWRTPAYHVGDGEALLEATTRAGPRGHRRQAARLPVRARARAPRLAEGQERPHAGRRDRRLDCRARAGAADASASLAVGFYDGRRAAATPARSAPASPSRRSRCVKRELEPLRARRHPVQRPPAAEGHDLRRARLVAERRVPRVDHAAARSARPRSRACGPTSTRRNACARKVNEATRPGKFEDMPRAIWSGAISFGLVNVPVKLYSAVSQKTVRFHQLDARDRRAHPAEAGRLARRRGGPVRADRQGLRDQPRPLRDDHARRSSRRSSPRRRARSTSRSSSTSTRSTRSTTTTRTTSCPTRAPRRPTSCCWRRWRRRTRSRSRAS